MKTGLDCLASSDRGSVPVRALLKGKRTGLITNYTAVTSRFQSSVEVLGTLCRLEKLFGPEHGIRGDAQAGAHVESTKDTKSGLSVYSLYGETRKPTQAMLADLDVLVFDIQDAGLRFYTYLYTMTYAMEACAEAGIPFVVLDRPNPLGGEIVQGNLLEEDCRSFVGKYSVPQRFGLTIAEFACFVNDTYGIDCDLHIVPLSGWRRDSYFSETGQPWVFPSPNIPTPATLLAYVGTCLFEGTNLSEGRGTTRPFELIGAPWLDADAVADGMNALALTGLYFRPHFFTPCFSKHAGALCAGVQIHIDPSAEKRVNLIEASVRLLCLIRGLHPEAFEFLSPSSGGNKCFIDLISGSKKLRIEDDCSAYLADVTRGAELFMETRRSFLLYT